MLHKRKCCEKAPPFGALLAIAMDELEKVAQLRAAVERHDPAATEVDDPTLRRFLRARNHDVDKASSMFLNFLAWRRSAMPGGSVGDDEVKNELSKKKAFSQGVDKSGRPLLVLLAARHRTADRDMDEFKRFVPFCFDKICSKISSRSDEEKFTCIVDFKGWGYSNCDIRGYITCIEILQNYYPERLAKAFMIHVPYMFMAAWKTIYPFIDNNTKKKFIFVEDGKLHSTLLEEIEATQLPEMYGGDLQLVPINN